MIPLAHIQQWTAHAPWPDLRQVEQDLIICRAPLLPAGVTFDNEVAIVAFGRIWGELIGRIPGDSWKSSKVVIEAIRKAKIPSLLQGVYE